MITRILAGTTLAAATLAGWFYTQGLRQDAALAESRAEIAALATSLSVTRANLATERLQRAAAEEAAAVLRIHRAEADRIAREASAAREAIIGGDDDAISDIRGPLGDALRVLRAAAGNQCDCAGSAGDGGDRPVSTDTGP